MKLILLKRKNKQKKKEDYNVTGDTLYTALKPGLIKLYSCTNNDRRYVTEGKNKLLNGHNALLDANKLSNEVEKRIEELNNEISDLRETYNTQKSQALNLLEEKINIRTLKGK